jgi:hypothetical protein
MLWKRVTHVPWIRVADVVANEKKREMCSVSSL